MGDLEVMFTKTETPVPHQKPICRVNGNCWSQGILIYNDLNKAATVGAFKLTENDSKYADEIRTMMVAPLNAWDGNRQSMIGIIYITSRERKTFSAKHVDSLRFIADKVAKAIGFTVENLKQIGCVKTLLRSK